MNQDDPKQLVSTTWLAAHLADPDIRIVDGSWHLPVVGRNARAEYADRHIPGAVFFDIDEISDQTNPLPHMVPSAEQFAAQVGELGIGSPNQVVVYDSTGIFSAARVWWLFRYMGHSDICVLNGGLPRWLEEDRVVSAEVPRHETGQMTAIAQSHMVRDVGAVRSATTEGTEQIVDARPAARFMGQQVEPRPGLRSGHMPGAHNVPHQMLLNPNGTMKSRSELEDVFTASGVTMHQPIITSCGSGVTAAVVSLALEIMGHSNHSLYDGSWSEWGACDDLSVVA